MSLRHSVVVKLLVVVVAILLLNLLVGYTVVSYHNINPIPGKSHNNEGGPGLDLVHPGGKIAP